ncbi:hypothetical protein [Kordia jejudonensis]|uniref:hypothetical protein n=1 Tax=Kordia jejudonensis TaxID=1348245 RepID=UPI000629577D|nr:hypothetical protein [Kordia jejudonensis]
MFKNTLIFIMFTATCFAQIKGEKKLQECELTLKDSTAFRGFCRIGKVDKIHFSMERDSTPDVWDSKDVKSVRFFRSDYDQVLEYFNLRKNSLPRLLEIKLYGDVMLYARTKFRMIPDKTITVYPSLPPFGKENDLPQQRVVSYKKEEEVSAYYLKKASSDTLFPIRPSWTNRRWKKEMIEFFKDCPSLVEDLEADAYDKKSIAQLVEDYNLYCTEND